MVEGAPLERVGGETKVLQTRDGRDVSRVFSKSFSPLRISCNFNRNLHFHKTSSTSREKKRGKKKMKTSGWTVADYSSSGRPLISEKEKLSYFPPFFYLIFTLQFRFIAFLFLSIG
jgi:hypothetical protein